MVHGAETEYNSKVAIELNGSKFGTNNGTTGLIQMSREVYHREVAYFRSQNLVSRVRHETLDTIPLPAVVSIGLGTRIICRY